MPVAGVIFDCDGTLLDSIGVWTAMQDQLAARAGASLNADDDALLCTLTIPETGAFFHERFGLGRSPGDVVGMIDDIMVGYYANQAVARPGALDFVRSLHGEGVRCSVASSTPGHLLQAGLAQTGFAPYLSAIVSVDDVGRSKREPAVYHRACELMGTPQNATWVFEDAVYAIKTARTAGYHTVGIYDTDTAGTWEELLAHADKAIHTFGELDARAFVKGEGL
jgi:HAD superfamily hydrolase (TIGR01509 family)